MDRVLTVTYVIAPIFFAIALGMLARKRNILSSGEIEGLQHFVIKFCVPCVIFNSCLTADITPYALISMALLPPIQLLGVCWGFWARKRRYPYHNLPFLYVCKETGMMGIPLFMLLFGADQAYRMGVLDMTQAMLALPMIGILSADTQGSPSAKAVARQILTSPMILLGVLGLVLNLTGLWSAIQAIGMGKIVTESISFLSEPISAVMLFCVGYNFTLNRESRAEVLRLSAIHMGYFAAAGVLVQLILSRIPGVDALTRWAALLYFLLPCSYLAPGLGRQQKDFTVASGMCSLTTLASLLAFCIMAAFVK